MLLVSDDSDGSTKTVRLGPNAVQLAAFGVFLVALLVICYVVWSAFTIEGLKGISKKQRLRMSTLTEERDALSSENATLTATVERLSQSISQKAIKEANSEEAEAKKHLPTGFPISGAATMTDTVDLADAATFEEEQRAMADAAANGENEDTPKGDPILFFSGTTPGSGVISAAVGKVVEAGVDTKYGNRVVVDHGNGYQTIYRNAGDPMVKEGEEVIQGSILFVIGDNNTVGFQIKKDGKFIEPETMTQMDG